MLPDTIVLLHSKTLEKLNFRIQFGFKKQLLFCWGVGRPSAAADNSFIYRLFTHIFLFITSEVAQNGHFWYIILSQKSRAKRSEKQTSVKKTSERFENLQNSVAVGT